MKGFQSVLLLALLQAVTCFNLDEGSALVYEGQKDSRFGYSVALSESDVLVGAPNSSGAGRGKYGGSIRVCSTRESSCEDRVTVNTLHKRDRDYLDQAKLIQSVDLGIGLGEHLHSPPNSQNAMACVPRYPFIVFNTGKLTRRGLYPRGACMVLNDRNQLIVPVNNEVATNYENGGRYVNTISYTGSSETGFSGFIQDDGTMFMGGPYGYYGQGTLFKHSRGSSIEMRNDRKKFANGDFQMEHWAMVSGKFDGVNDILATSAPNYDMRNMIGKVRLYNIQTARVSSVSLRSGITLTGSISTSMYGFSMTKGDIDGDGVDDLVISEPYYNGYHGANEAYGTENIGVVHIVYGPAKRSVGRDSLMLTNPGRSGLFGLSVFCPNDLNKDGFEDLVVGAPDLERGKVFIYNGSPDGLDREPSQIIEGSKHLPSLSASIDPRFGFSISGGHDVDGNGVPDLIIGSVGADVAVLFRSAPVLTLLHETTFSPKIVSLKKNTCDKRTSIYGETNTCFFLVLRMSYNSTVYREPIDVQVHITLDEAFPGLRTVFHAATTMEEKNSPTRNQTMRIRHHDDRTEATDSFKLHLIGDRPSQTELITANIHVSLPPTVSSQSEIVAPVLMNTEFETHARLTCDDDTEGCYARSDLKLFVEASPLVIGGGLYRMNITVTAEKSTAYQVAMEINYQSLLIFSHTYSSQTVLDCSNITMSSNHTRTINCILANALPQNEQLDFSLYFRHQPLKLLEMVTSSNSPSIIGFFVSSDSDDLNNADNRLTFPISTKKHKLLVFTADNNPEQVRVNLNQTLRKLDILPLNDPNISTSVTKLGPEVTHTFTLVNVGPTPLLSDTILIDWPLQYEYTTTGGILPVMYIAEPIVTIGPIQCVTPPINPLNLTLPEIETEEDDSYSTDNFQIENDTETSSAFDTKRKRRSAVKMSEKIVSAEKLRENMFSCEDMICYTIRCKFEGLLAGEQVEVQIKSYITIAALPTNVSGVSVTASLESDREDRYTQEISTRLDIVLPPPNFISLLSGNWWIILLAGILGLFFLILIGFGLYKCGFFKRQKLQEVRRGRESMRKSQMIRQSQMARQSQPAPSLTKEQEQEMQQLYVQEQLAQEVT